MSFFYAVLTVLCRCGKTMNLAFTEALQDTWIGEES